MNDQELLAQLPNLSNLTAGKGIIVAIDGPSGAGKSSVAKAVSVLIGGDFLDTGAMYRALTWQALQEKLDLDDGEALGELALRLDLQFRERIPGAEPECENLAAMVGQRVFIGEREVTGEIRSEEINALVSKISAHGQVRKALVKMQQDYIATRQTQGKAVVAEGRDITTVVAPQAQVRILLTASAQVRAERRGLQSGSAAAAAIAERDAKDALVNNIYQAAAGVETIDSSELSFVETISAVLDLVEKAAIKA